MKIEIVQDTKPINKDKDPIGVMVAQKESGQRVSQPLRDGEASLSNPLYMDVTKEDPDRFKQVLYQYYQKETGDELAKKLMSLGYDCIVTKLPNGKFNDIILLSNCLYKFNPMNMNEGIDKTRLAHIIAEEVSLFMENEFYHGSPHDFVSFDMSKVGTGDEKQKYGYGLYFTDSPDTATQYAQDLTLGNSKSGLNVYQVKLIDLKNYHKWEESIYGIFQDVYDELIDLGKEEEAEQLKEETSEENGYEMWTFGDLYEWLSYVMGSPESASKFLYDDVGVSGVIAKNAWLDGNIYVAFSDDLIKIVDKKKVNPKIFKEGIDNIIKEEIQLFFEGRSQEFQVRDIDGSIYYKRKRGDKYWRFTDEKDFKKNANKDNVIAWMPDVLKERVERDRIADKLKKFKKGDFVTVKINGKENVVFFAGYRDNGFYATTYRPGEKQHRQDDYFKIFPSKKVDIIKLGNESVETAEDFSDRIDAYKEIERMEKVDMYKQAYARDKRDPNIQEAMPFDEKDMGNKVYIREFDESIDSSKLVWHRDKEDRVVEPMHETDWKFQFDNELPQAIEGELFIQKESFHRIIKGTGSLKLKITKIT